MAAEDLIESSDVGQENGAGAGPFIFIEVGGKEFHFNEGFSLGMEVAAGIAAEVFNLVVKAFGQIGGAQLWMNGRGIFDESQVVSGAFFEVIDPGFVVGAQAVQERAEFSLSAFEAAGGLDFTPAVLKEGVVFQAEVTLGVAQEVDGAELMIGVGEETFNERGQAAEIIGDQQQNPNQAAIFK